MIEQPERAMFRAERVCALREEHARTKRIRDEALADRNFAAADGYERRMAELLRAISIARVAGRGAGAAQEVQG